MRYDEGYKLHVGALSSEYVETGMSDTTFNSILPDVYTEVCDAVKENLKQHRQSCMDLGYYGPFLGAQLDLTTVANEEYITFSVSYIAEGDATITRVGLATRAFPGPTLLLTSNHGSRRRVVHLVSSVRVLGA